MYIVINCLGLPFNGETVKTCSLGGSESAAYYMAKALVEKGHSVTMFTNGQESGEYDGVRYIYAGEQTQEKPLGTNFHFYAENTPHDVLIIQRHPGAFHFNWASKINLWWLHDLALSRDCQSVQNMLWNVDGIITVSRYHKEQVCSVYGVAADIVHPVINAVDGDLFKEVVTREDKSLIYISRPERGLEHLVKPGGIMERLPDHKLYVCGYDNTTEQMRPYYEYLWDLCDKLPNVHNMGSLSKPQLASLMKSCDALIYPTPGPLQPDFKEVSCISVMEAMHAGIGILTSAVGALPETCSSSNLVPLVDGMPDEDEFVRRVNEKQYLYGDGSYYQWNVACDQLIDVIMSKFSNNITDIGRYYMDVSDIKALEILGTESNLIGQSMEMELHECYGFTKGCFKEHYDAYYKYEQDRGAIYGPEDLTNNLRFNHVASFIANVPAGGVVGDYGCAHGHYTINLAKRFPDKTFIGYDIAQSNIDKAREWADSEGIENVDFVQWSVGEPGQDSLAQHDVMIVCELLEHVNRPQEIINALSPYSKLFIVSTPFGPWEAIGYKEHWPWRAHIHHLERQDITDIFGHLDNYALTTVPSGCDQKANQLGSYVYTFSPSAELGQIDYDRKLKYTQPWQTLSLCMIIKDAENSIESTLESCKGVIHEAIFGIDANSTDQSKNRIIAFCVNNRIPFNVINIPSALETGFSEARNRVIEKASGSWIMWLDSDELLINGNNLTKYLRANQYNGYAVHQNHFSCDPPAVLKTDFPVKIFRNRKNIKFIGLVHEHPETEVNKGVGHTYLLPDISLAHHGYQDEPIRKKRFDRNIGLLERDRKLNPDRILGKFLYLRDLAQMCGYDAESGVMPDKEVIQARVESGTQLWLDLIESKNLRLIIDALPYYSGLSRLSGKFIEVAFNIDFARMGETKLDKSKEIVGCFRSVEHFDLLFDLLKEEKMKGL